MSRAQKKVLTISLEYGFDMLDRGESAHVVVEAVIAILEGSGLFNAGLGSRRQQDGVRRMDASMMEGRTLRAGAVASLVGARHPIRVARAVMEQTGHVLLVGIHAGRLAKVHRLLHTPFPPRVGAVYPEKPNRGRSGRTRPPELETVGAVVRDCRGCLASGASTGGIGVMMPGRVGDSPLIGSGVYADNETGAISMTGVGESIIRIGAAKEISDLLAAGRSPAQAGRNVLIKLVRRVQGFAGALILSRDGKFSIRHTSPYMTAGYWGGTRTPVVSDRFFT